MAKKSDGMLGGRFGDGAKYDKYGNNATNNEVTTQRVNEAPPGPTSMDMVNDGNKGRQAPVNNMMNFQPWPAYGPRQFDQPGYGYQLGYGSHRPMSWNRPIYGQSLYYQPYMPYMYGKK